MTSKDDASGLTDLRNRLESAAVPENVEAMAAYMRNQFEFLGVRSPGIRTATKAMFDTVEQRGVDGLIGLVDRCWAAPEREFQSAGVLLLRRFADLLEPQHLDDLHRYITTKSWWDTVDGLAAWSVGPLVRAEPALVEDMDRWIESDNIWVARTAIIHQLGFKEHTDAERLFNYSSLRAEDREFFIRKAIGWALRQYARVDPVAVREFVLDNEGRLSGLSRREALKHLDG